MNSDFKDLLLLFAEEGVEYMVVGGYAVIHYTQPRYTKDIDIWLKPSEENSWRVMRAFNRFGMPLIDVTREDFTQEGLQYVVGVAPCQIDFLTSLPGLGSFDDAMRHASKSDAGNSPILFLGKDDLITAKRTAGRLQDLADIEEIERASD